MMMILWWLKWIEFLINQLIQNFLILLSILLFRLISFIK